MKISTLIGVWCAHVILFLSLQSFADSEEIDKLVDLPCISIEEYNLDANNPSVFYGGGYRSDMMGVLLHLSKIVKI